MFAKEVNHLFDDMQDFRKDHKRISDSIAESKRKMEEKSQKRKLIRNK